jgi:hypothetical protein
MHMVAFGNWGSSIASATALRPTFYAAVSAGCQAVLQALAADEDFRRGMFGRRLLSSVLRGATGLTS